MKWMKRGIAVLLALAITVSFSGCVASGKNVEIAVDFFVDDYPSVDEDCQFDFYGTVEENRQYLLNRLQYERKANWRGSYGDKELQKLTESKKFGKAILEALIEETYRYGGYDDIFDTSNKYDKNYGYALDELTTNLEIAGINNSVVRKEFHKFLAQQMPTDEEIKNGDPIEMIEAAIDASDSGAYYGYSVPDSIIDCACGAISGDTYDRTTKMDLLHKLEYGAVENEKILAAANDFFAGFSISDMTEQEFVAYTTQVCKMPDIHYYTACAKLLPADEVSAYLKAHGRKLTLDNKKGLFRQCGRNQIQCRFSPRHRRRCGQLHHHKHLHTLRRFSANGLFRTLVRHGCR